MRLIPQDARVLRLLLPFIDRLYKIRKTIANRKTDSHALRSCPFFMLIFRQNPRSRRCRNGVVLRHCSKQRRFLPGCFLS